MSRGAHGYLVTDCTWCGSATETALGVYLERVANGRRICVPCGRFTLTCECEKAGVPVTVSAKTADISLPFLGRIAA